MAKRTIDFEGLATDGPMDARLPALNGTPPRLRRVPVGSVAANPINPREDLGDLSDLDSMKTRQLQPCAVVTRATFLAIYPEHADALNGAEFVVVAGSRRRQAAEKFGLATLDIVVNDTIGDDRGSFYGASLLENMERKALTPMEEARGIERLVAECGGVAARAAEVLNHTEQWMSQKRVLLKLSPAMQDHLQAGRLRVHDARRLAKMEPDEQEPTWLAEQAAEVARRRLASGTRKKATQPDDDLPAGKSSLPSLDPPTSFTLRLTIDGSEPLYTTAEKMRRQIADDDLFRQLMQAGLDSVS